MLMKKSYKFFFIYFLMIFPVFNLYSSELELGPIIVEKEHGLLISDVGTFLNPIINEAAVSSPENILEFFSFINVQSRSSNAIQQDLSIRGSIFEDNNIFIDGVKINNSQTGHFSAEIPLILEDIDFIQADPNTNSVYFVTKEPDNKSFIKSVFGEHAFFQQSASLGFKVKDFKTNISLQKEISSGDKQDRDFNVKTVSFRSLWDKTSFRLKFLGAVSNKDFGAANFYSSSFNQEGETTDQRIFILTLENYLSHKSIVTNLFYKRYADHFFLIRHNPSYYQNYHTNYLFGAKTAFNFDNGLFSELEIREEKITSTNLNSRSREQQKISFGFKEKQIYGFSVMSKYSLYNYDYLGFINSFSLSLYWKKKLDLIPYFRFCYDFRVPSFTELYYNSPSNIGNSQLKEQKYDNYELGVKWMLNERLSSKLAFFYRDQRSVIDWVKNSPANPWQAVNVGNIQTKGVEISSRMSFNSDTLKAVSLGYTYLELDKKNDFNYSKYLFNYLRHKATMMLDLNVFRNDLILAASFNKPLSKNAYFLCDLRLSRQITAKTKVFFDINNLFNTDYEELSGIKADGRWVKFGLMINF